MDLADEVHAVFESYRVTGMPRPPDVPAAHAPGPAAWVTRLTLAEAQALDRATSDGARNGPVFVGSTFPDRVSRGQRSLTAAQLARLGNAGPHGSAWQWSPAPATEAEARSMRDAQDRLVQSIEAQAVNIARHRVAQRDAVVQEMERRTAEADRKSFEDRVRAAADQRLRETGQATERSPDHGTVRPFPEEPPSPPALERRLRAIEEKA